MTLSDFKRCRRELSRAMAEQARARGEEVRIMVVPFTNDDVPKFLRRLAEFEKPPKDSKIRVKGAYVQEPTYK